MITKWLVGTAAVMGVAALSVGLTLTVVGSRAGEAPDRERILAAAATTGGGFSEGIKIHGDWVIEVMDPDGTVVERREFENAYKGNGDELAAFLAREKYVGGWSIQFTPPDGSPDSICSTYTCQILEPENPAGFGMAKTVAVSTSTEGESGSKLIVKGNATATEDGLIGSVGTSLTRCDSSSVCFSFPKVFTQSSVNTVTVSEGQQVQFTVTISFA